MGVAGSHCVSDFRGSTLLQPLVSQLHNLDLQLRVNRTGPEEVTVQAVSPLGTGTATTARLLGHSCFGTMYITEGAIALQGYTDDLSRLPRTTEDMARAVLPVASQKQLHGALPPCSDGESAKVEYASLQGTEVVSRGGIAGIAVGGALAAAFAGAALATVLLRHRRKRVRGCDTVGSEAGDSFYSDLSKVCAHSAVCFLGFKDSFPAKTSIRTQASSSMLNHARRSVPVSLVLTCRIFSSPHAVARNNHHRCQTLVCTLLLQLYSHGVSPQQSLSSAHSSGDWSKGGSPALPSVPWHEFILQPEDIVWEKNMETGEKELLGDGRFGMVSG
jgi:hypothetical protein